MSGTLLMEVIESGLPSGSVSFERRVKGEDLVSSSVTKLSLMASGLSLTGVTLILRFDC